MEFIGTKGRARLLNDFHTRVFVLRAGAWQESGVSHDWVPLAPGATASAAALGGQGTANRLVIDDWLAAIAAGREAVCSGFAAMKSLEMIHAVFAAGLARTRVALPLTSRAHPLAAA